MSTFIKGEVAILSIREGVAWEPIACLTSNSFKTDISVIESNTKCNPGVTIKQAGIFTYSLDAEGQLIDTTTVGGDTTKQSHDAIYLKQINKVPVQWKLDTNVNNSTSTKYFGTAIITSLSAEFGAGDDLSTFSVTLDGSGAVLLVDPNV